MAVRGSREFTGPEMGILVEIVHDYFDQILGTGQNNAETRRLFLDLCASHGMTPDFIENFATKLDLEKE